ncbi:Gfo/Idh/MocA family oxidoreductase [Gammaproteobacteria bacterium]|nr:Gfo/Idh/MocA family oxidoreductase [Gammaproteobacteria bacterium]|tara:strand:- start:83 stop:1222 length:1140 start_codon:yes stop_codon:yes gene_type:complete
MQKIKLGMVGGGKGSFIGEIHRMAARLDGRYQIVAGALSSDPKIAAASAEENNIEKSRSYDSFEIMAEKEKELTNGIDAVAIVTPNHLHASVAKAFLKKDIHVICDKPITTELSDAEELEILTNESGLIFAVTYNYSGYPMVRQAKEMIAAGKLGNIRIIQLEYAQDWLSEGIEKTGHKQAAWRTNPKYAGKGGAIGDIGTHAFHLAEFITGLKTSALLADLESFVAGRTLDDNANILMQYNNGAKGMLWVSQVASGKENGLQVRIYGDKAGIEWSQEEPNQLRYSPLGDSMNIITRAGSGAGQLSNQASRLPSGHPEGFIEGFANIYQDTADLIVAHNIGGQIDSLVPNIQDGVRGIRFIEKAVASNQAGSIWLSLED